MATPEDQSASPPRKRRWYQFSLRTLLIVMLLASFGMSWFAVKLQQARRQREAVAAIREAGGAVQYDYPFLSGVFVTGSEPAELAWPWSLLGEDIFARVFMMGCDSPGNADACLAHVKALPHLREIWLTDPELTDDDLKQLKESTQLQILRIDGGPKVTDAGLQHLNGLTQLQCLSLHRTQVTGEGLRRLIVLSQLQVLWLDGTRVTDAELKHLKNLTQVSMLALDRTQVTEVGVAQLKELSQLQTLIVNDKQASDAQVRHLKGLTQLRHLWFYRTQVSDAGVMELQQALPNCDIKRY